MSRIRIVLGLLLAVLIMMGWGCASKASRTPPATEPAPITGGQEPAAEPDAPSAASPGSVAFMPSYFAVDSHALGADARAALDHNARLLLAHPQLNITIEGHCDERGTVEYNLALGERRARAARDYLVLSGVESSRMVILSYGEERPFQQGQEESAWAANRRAHLVER